MIKQKIDTARLIEVEDEYLYNDYGRGCPDISFLIKKKYIGWQMSDGSRLDFMDSRFNLMLEVKGEYWISRKNKDCFRPSKNGIAVLYKSNYYNLLRIIGAAGLAELESKSIYYHRSYENVYFILGKRSIK